VNEFFDHAMLVAHGDDKTRKFLDDGSHKFYELPEGEEPTAEWMAREILEWFVDFAHGILGRSAELGMVGVELFEGVGSSASIEVGRAWIDQFLAGEI